MTYISHNGILRQEEGDALANLLRKGWLESPQPSFNPSTDQCLWEDGEWVVSDIPPTPIPRLTPRQCRLWLNQVDGRLTTVRAALNSLPTGKAKEDALIEWEFAVTVERGHPMVEMVKNLLTLSDTDMDTAFREASLL